MSHRIRIWGIFLAGMGFLWLAFQVPVYTPLVEKELKAKLEKYRSDQWESCKKRAREQASHEVDSMIIAWAKANRDTISRPVKPDKPLAPEILNPQDSTPIAPLFNGQDTTKEQILE
jgi:hypothetical protein